MGRIHTDNHARTRALLICTTLPAIAGLLGACAGGSASSANQGPPRGQSAPLIEPEPSAPPPPPASVTPDALADRVRTEAASPPPASTAAEPARPDAYTVPDWATAAPAIPGRVTLVASAEGDRVRETRLAAIDAGLAALARRLSLQPGDEPADARVERAAVLPKPGGGFTAYVLISAPAD